MNITSEVRASRVPLLIVAITQAMLVFNVTALKISIDAIVASYEAPAAAVKSAIVVYSLAVAGCIMLGARIAPKYGSKRVFRVTTALFGTAMLAIALSTNVVTMIIAQLIAGVAAAALVPSAAALIAENYSDGDRTRALGLIGAVRSVSAAPAFLVAGMIATWSSWRYAYMLMLPAAAIVYVLSNRLGTSACRSNARIDVPGTWLVLMAALSIGIGINNISDWGLLRARPEAPFHVLQLSPAPLLLALGLVALKLILVWSRRCRAGGRAVLVAPELLGTPRDRITLFSMFVIASVGAAVTFLIPLYIEVIQGRSSLSTAVAMVPFTLSSVAAAVLAARLSDKRRMRSVARYGFLVVAAGLTLLGTTIRDDWSDSAVIASLTIAGCGEGALATLLVRLLVEDAPPEQRDDVDPVCSATSHFAVGIGTALAGALVIGTLGTAVQRDLAANPETAHALRMHLNLDKVSFISNDRLRQVLEQTPATAEQIAEALRVNTKARLGALKLSFLTLAGMCLVAFIASVRVPKELAQQPFEHREHERF